MPVGQCCSQGCWWEVCRPDWHWSPSVIMTMVQISVRQRKERKDPVSHFGFGQPLKQALLCPCQEGVTAEGQNEVWCQHPLSDAQTQSGCPKVTLRPAQVGFKTILSACERTGFISAPFEAALKGSQGHSSSQHLLHCGFALYRLPRSLSLQSFLQHILRMMG